MGNHKQTELQFTDKANAMMKVMPDFVKHYIRAIAYTTSPRTRYEYLKDIEALLKYMMDAKDLKTIEASHIDAMTKMDFEEYFEYLEHYEYDGRERTNGRKSIARKLSSLRQFCAYLFESELITSDEIRKVAMPKLHTKEIIRMDPDETSNFLTVVENGTQMTSHQRAYHKKQVVRDLAIVYLLLSTGLRVSECAELDISDVDMVHSCVHVVRKGGDEATVYFSDEAAKYIDDYLAERLAMKEMQNESALFLSSRKTRMNVRTIEILIRKYAIRAVPGKRITPHKLRSTYATSLYEATDDIYLVAETLGHNDVSTTKKHYANMSSKRKEGARNKVILRPEI